jgi:adenylate kinase family enzyme
MVQVKKRLLEYYEQNREVIIAYSQKLMEVEKYFDDNFQVLINYLELKAELENVKSGD